VLAAIPPPAPVSVASPDPEMVRNLVEMGFPEARAVRALNATAPAGLEYAMEWLLSRVGTAESEDGDGDVGSGDGDSDEDDDDENENDEDVDEDEVGADADENVGYGDGGMMEHNEDSDEGDLGDNLDEMEGELADALDRAYDYAVDHEGEHGNDVVEQGDNRGVDGVRIRDGVERNLLSRRHDVAGRSDAMRDLNTDAPADRIMSDSHGGDGPAHSAEAPVEAPELFELGSAALRPDRQSTKAATLHDAEDNSGSGTGTETETRAPSLLSLDGNADELLQISADSETDDLLRALEKTSSLSRRTTDKLVSQFHGLMLPNFVRREHSTPANDLKGGKAVIKPVEVGSYNDSKQKLFESLQPMLRRAIAGDNESGDPALLAVDLLSAMERCGFLTFKAREDYAMMIADGFRSPTNNKYSRYRVGAMWAHHGGKAARSALVSCDIGTICLSILERGCTLWEKALAAPTFDDDTVRPIQKLSIGDAMPPASISGSIGSNHVLELAKIAPCLLLLDAFVRFGKQDAVREAALKLSTKEKTDAKVVGEDGSTRDPGDRTDERRPRVTDTGGGDGDNDDAGANNDDDDDAGADNGDQNGANDDDVVDEITPAAPRQALPAITEDDDVAVDEQLQQLKLESYDTKERAFKATRDEILGLLYPDVALAFSKTLSLDKTLDICLKLLRLWKDKEVGDALTAVLQLLTSLTSDSQMASKFVSAGGLELLLELPSLDTRRVSSTDPRLVRSYTRTIVRHVVEDLDTMCAGMETELRMLFATKFLRGRPTTPRALLFAAAPLAERDLPAFIQALSNVCQLRNDRRTLEAIPVADASDKDRTATQGTTTKNEEEVTVPVNVRAVIDSLVMLLVSTSEGQQPLSAGVALQSSASGVSDDTARAIEHAQHKSVFAMYLLTELVTLFPSCARALVETRSPSPLVDGTALDFVIRHLLPLPTPVSWRTPVDLARASLELVAALYGRPGLCCQSAVDAVSCAAVAELARAKPRAGAIGAFADCVNHARVPHVLRAFLASGVADSLAQSLDKLELNLSGMNEVVISVLRALEELGAAAIAIAEGTIDDDYAEGGGPAGHHSTGRAPHRGNHLGRLMQQAGIFGTQQLGGGGARGGRVMPPRSDYALVL
jgi:hypothetical protein